MKKYISFGLILISSVLIAQDDEMQKMLDSMNAEQAPAEIQYVRATFKTTRVVNFPSCETTGKKLLDFRIMHRFGEITSGFDNFFGIDGPAGIKLGFDYGLNDRIAIGIGRSSYDKMIDGNIKVKLMRQSDDNKKPLTITYQGTTNVTLKKDPRASQGIDKYDMFTSRMSYSNTITLARKFSDKLSLQLHGFHVHYNMVDDYREKNDIFAAGISGRYKLTARMALTFEYAYRLNNYVPDKSVYQDPFAIGLDIETGGHVFQLHFTNGYGINEVQFIPYSTSDILQGQLRLGFNISRVFTIGKHEGSTW